MHRVGCIFLTLCAMLSAGMILILFQRPLFDLAFLLSPASAEVETLARDYMAIRVWSAPAIIALYGITGWLIALERTRAASSPKDIRFAILAHSGKLQPAHL